MFKVIAGVVVGVATVPDNPFAVTTETLDTVPVPEAESTKSLCVVGSAYKVTIDPSFELDRAVNVGLEFSSSFATAMILV